MDRSVRKKLNQLILLALMVSISACAFQGNEKDTSEINDQTNSPSLSVSTLEPINLKIGVLAYTGYAPFYFAEAEGFYTEQGLDVELINFSQQKEANVALATGQIDILGGPVDVANLAAMSEGIGLKVVADKGFVNPNADCYYATWMATKDLFNSGELDNLENIKGKKLLFQKLLILNMQWINY